MAGTLTISTLSDGTNSTSSTNCIQGSAKAWVNFNGTAATIRSAFNVSSITRSATGQYVVNFTTAMADANYATMVSSKAMDTGAVVAMAVLGQYNNATNPASASSVQVELIGSTAARADSAFYNVAVFR